MESARDYLRETVKSGLVRFTLVCAAIVAIGAPLFALSDALH
jgi:hypothetical protein